MRQACSLTAKASHMHKILILALICCGLHASDLRSSPALDGEPVEISTTLFILDIDGIDTQSQSFEANVFLNCQWLDPRLAHNGTADAIYEMGAIWHPNLQILNQQKLWKTFPDQLEVSADGTVSYRQRYWGNFSQPLDLRGFPFDSQTFAISVTAALRGAGKVHFVPSERLPPNIAEKLSVADWTITGTDFRHDSIQIIPKAPANDSFVFTVSAERKSGYFIVKVIIPLILIVAMSWIVFWIDPAESGTQISVAITTMLTLIAYRFAVDALLPKVSYLTALDYFILTSTLLVYASLIEVLLTSHFAKKQHRVERAYLMDRWCRVLFPAMFVATAFETLKFRFFL